MDGFFTFAEHLFKGGPEAIITFLVLVIALLVWDRKRLHDDIRRKEDKLDKIVDDYHKGNLTIAEAMNSLKYVLAEIRGKLS